MKERPLFQFFFFFNTTAEKCASISLCGMLEVIFKVFFKEMLILKGQMAYY